MHPFRKQRRRRGSGASIFAAALGLAWPVAAAEAINRPPVEADWLALAKAPDWSGVWTPDVTDQFAQHTSNAPPYKAEIAKQVQFLQREYDAGRPFLILKGCLPHGMPTLMLITHNALEFLMTPGRVTILGESDGNRLRRIYTDGRGHPTDPDLTFHGHSIGRWEGDTLMVDTVGILPEAWIATDEAVGIPNNGDMQIVERIHLSGPDTLLVEMEITAPKVLTKPWKTTRIYYRQRAQRFDIVEGECVQGNFTPGRDKFGNAILNAIPLSEDGSVTPRGE